MLRLYNKNIIFFYKEETYLYFYGYLGSCKINLNCMNFFFFYNYSNFFFIQKKHNNFFLFFKMVNKLFISVSTLLTSISNGIVLKFGPKGKRTRVTYNKLLFFFKLGYSSRIPYILPLNTTSYAKEKKVLFFNLCGLDYNSISKSLFHILSFRLIDPYNFGGLMLKDGFFKYTNWSRRVI